MILLKKFFLHLNSSLVHSVTIGKFRMSQTFLKKINKIRPEDTLFFYNSIKNTKKEEEMISLFYKQVQKFIDKEKYFIIKTFSLLI